MKKITISGLLVIILLQLIQVNSQLQLDFCTTFGTANITYNYYSNLRFNYTECTGCVDDPNRSQTTINCACDHGYYFNGSQCTKHKAGILFEDDFESPTTIADNWDRRETHPDISTILEFNTDINSNVAKFTRGRIGGDMYTRTTFSGLPHDHQIRVIFDYNTLTGAILYLGKSRYGAKEGNHQWDFGPAPVTGPVWDHQELVLDLVDDIFPVEVMLEDIQTPFESIIDRTSIDNFMVTSIHGPTEINVGAYSNIYPSFMVLSHDYTGFDGENTLQQFNFDITNMNTLLGRTDWNTEEFAIYIPETDTVAVVILYDDSGSQYNGGSLGRGHGRFKTNASNQDQKYFFPGQYLSFDNQFSKTIADFESLTGTSEFTGPFKDGNQNLAGCFNDCQDFEHFNEALTECMKNTGCNGVKYTHRFWGGANSQGPNKGYGYQLRTTGVESNTREFEFSFTKRASFDQTQYHYRTQCKQQKLTEQLDFGYSEKSIRTIECQVCDLSDTNRKNELPLCPCKDNYYDDGSQLRTIGVIQEDNFNTGAITDNWSGNLDDSFTPQASFAASQLGSDQCVTFPSIRTKGDIFFKAMYQTLQHNEEVLIMFDYIDEGNAGLGFGFSNMYPGDYKLVYTTSATDAGNTYLSPQIPKSQTGKWSHFEGTFSALYQSPFRIMFQEHISALGESFLDNYVLSTIHGPNIIRNSPYSHLQPTLMILANDFTGFDGTATNQQFSFTLSELETILERPLVNGETFFVYLERTTQIEEIQFYNTSNGSSLGDAYGKFADPSSHSGTLVFKPGDFVIFSNNLAQARDQFTLETGTCLFDGPLRNENQDLEGCFNSCQDYATLEEAMQECLLEALCEGVTYSHKLWGGDNSQGFTRGYGYQLRTTLTTPSRNGFERKFEYSFKKRLINKKFQIAKDVTCSDCSHKCNTCVTSAENCLQCSEPNRINPPTCDCQIGFFENASNNNQCDQCDHSVCATCQNSDSECIVPCQEGCALCDTSNICLTPKPGHFVDPSDNIVKKCNNRICATCTGSPDSCILPCNPGCPTCSTDQLCTSCLLEQYLDNGVCKTCNPKCLLCDPTNQDTCTFCKSGGIGRTNELESKNCSCEDGYYENPEALDCVKCTNNACKKCDSNQKCTECYSDDYSLPDCKKIKQGFFLDTNVPINEEQSSQCSLKCEKCESSNDNCSECKQGFNREGAPSCGCLPGFHDNQGTDIDCQKCPTGCNTCLSSTHCTACEEGRVLNNFTNECECPEGQKATNNNQSCENCYRYLGKCVLECPFQSIENKSDMVCIEKSIINSDNSAYIWIQGFAVVLILTLLVSSFVLKIGSSQSKFKKEQNQKQENKPIEQQKQYKIKLNA